MKTKIIACEVIKEEILTIKPSHSVDFQFVSMGLHMYPAKLHKELQQLLDQSLGYSRIILTYGLCGGAAGNLLATNCLLTVPRVHDCIPLLLGSKPEYQRLQETAKGTFYLSGGWMEGELTLLAEYRRICQKYGQQRAAKVMSKMFDGYHRFLYIHTDHPREATNLAESRETASLLNLKHDCTHGNRRYLEKIVNGPWAEEEFINVPQGSSINELDFN